jgi:hypothetical protein
MGTPANDVAQPPRIRPVECGEDGPHVTAGPEPPFPRFPPGQWLNCKYSGFFLPGEAGNHTAAGSVVALEKEWKP